MADEIRGNDIDQITITEIRYKDHPDCTRDIVIEFPDYLGMKKISFIEAGLINAIPGVKDITVKPDNSKHKIYHVTPKVAIQFYGKLKTVYK